MALGVESASGICSARECTNAARYRIDWSNPAIHRARTKTWLACENHLAYLENYLKYRSFPFRISPFQPPNQSHCSTGRSFQVRARSCLASSSAD